MNSPRVVRPPFFLVQGFSQGRPPVSRDRRHSAVSIAVRRMLMLPLSRAEPRAERDILRGGPCCQHSSAHAGR